MAEAPLARKSDQEEGRWFTTTHWSVVLTASDPASPKAQEALGELARTYWFPLYSFVRQQGCSPEDAQDLTQAFFSRFLEKGYFAHADPLQGRFRTFLLTALKRFLVSEWRKEARQKRGGGQALLSWDALEAEQRYAAMPVEEQTPETLFEKRWALTLMERVLARLRQEYTAAGKEPLFARLADRIWGETDEASYAGLAGELGLSEGAVKLSMHRLRQRCREVLRSEVAHTVSRPEEVDEELRYLVGVLSG